MPSRNFEVESYTVLTTQSGSAATGAWRHLALTSPDLSHGIRMRVSLYFFPSPPNTLGVVTNVDQPNFNGLTVYAYLHKADFADWYDLLRNERPLRCYFGYSGPDYDPNQPGRTLQSVQLMTGSQEPPGEGAEELQTMLLPASLIEATRPAA